MINLNEEGVNNLLFIIIYFNGKDLIPLMTF